MLQCLSQVSETFRRLVIFLAIQLSSSYFLITSNIYLHAKAFSYFSQRLLARQFLSATISGGSIQLLYVFVCNLRIKDASFLKFSLRTELIGRVLMKQNVIYIELSEPTQTCDLETIVHKRFFWNLKFGADTRVSIILDQLVRWLKFFL